MIRREPDARTDALARSVIGAAIGVHRTLGPGYLEHVYEEAMCVELELRGVPFERQAKIAVRYEGRPIGESRLDLLFAGHLIVELEAVTSIAPIHRAQVLSYLKATGRPLALLIHFNVPVLRDGDPPHGPHRPPWPVEPLLNRQGAKNAKRGLRRFEVAGLFTQLRHAHPQRHVGSPRGPDAIEKGSARKGAVALAD